MAYKNEVKLQANEFVGNKTGTEAGYEAITTAELLGILDIYEGTEKETFVDGAGAVMLADTTTAGMGFVIDEDNMASDSATLVPTQQSVKAYVDDQIAGAVSSEMSYIGGYDALNDSDGPNPSAKKGDMYTVTVAGNANGYFTTSLEVGDVLISEIDNPSSEADWTVVQKDMDAASIKTSYESNADTNAFTDAEKTKLSLIEDAADVTDATNVEAAGAVMESDTTTSAMGFVIDEDSMSSNLDTKVPTQQSVKTYVDNQIATTVLDDELIDFSNGATDNGKPIKLDADGHIDASMINDADINLDNITEGTTNVFFTSADETKLSLIEDGADVTDATNVEAAGAVMESDTTTAAMGFVIDEDSMSSNLDTKVPTQQSVKAYVDNQIAGALSSEMSYIGGYDASAAAPSATANKGDMYTVTVAGNANGYFSTSLEVGDVLISEIDNPGSEADWTVVQKDMDAASIKTSYESNADTNAFTDAEKTKLSLIEDAADVTDATNVEAAGAVMESDTTTAAMGFVIDEDDMASDSDTKVPTQQSVKAYIDAQVDTVDTLQEVTDNGSETTNMIDITGGQDLGGGIETSLKIANNRVITMGGTDGLSGAWLSNDENPANPNSGTTVQVGTVFSATTGSLGSAHSFIGASTSDINLYSQDITSSYSQGKVSIGLAQVTLESVGTAANDKANISLTDRTINLSVEDDALEKTFNVLNATQSVTTLEHDTNTLTIDATGAAFNSSLSVQNGASIDEFSIDGTLSGDSDTALPTEKAVKTYVDTEVSANSSVVALQAVTAATDTYDSSSDIITVSHAGAVTLTIPTAWITDSQNKKVIIKDISGAAGTNNITLATQGSETIDGAASFVIDNNYEAITLFSDGTNLYVV